MKAIINIALKNGVLDSQGKATHHTLDTQGFKEIVADVRVGKQIIMELKMKLQKCVNNFLQIQ